MPCHWADLAPYSDSYGSIFYTITSLHAAHVIVGLLLLIYTGVVPRFDKALRTPHKLYAKHRPASSVIQ